MIVATIIAYTLFAGASASVLRAALMSGVAVAAVESGRGSRAMVALAWAAMLMLLVEPATIADVGFQLSTAATAGLVAWGTPLTETLERRVPRLPGALRESLGVSLAAQAATLPIVLVTFGRLALIAPAANLVAVPLVPPVMAAGLLAFVAGWLVVLGLPPWLGGLLAMPASMLLSVLIGVVRAAASVPGASATLGPPVNLAAGAAAAALLVPLHRGLTRGGRTAARPAIAARTTPRTRNAAPIRHLRWAFAGAALVTVLAGSVVAARPDGCVHVIVLNVGQGDAILLEGDLGGRILVDGGPDAKLLLSGLDRYIPSWDRRLDAIVLTHPHDDHVAGLVAVVREISDRPGVRVGVARGHAFLPGLDSGARGPRHPAPAPGHGPDDRPRRRGSSSPLAGRRHAAARLHGSSGGRQSRGQRRLDRASGRVREPPVPPHRRYRRGRGPRFSRPAACRRWTC